MNRPALGIRTWSLLTHLFVLVLPIALLVGSGALMHELRDQTRLDLHNQAALISLLATAELEHAPGARLGDVGDRLTPKLVDARRSTLAGIRVVDGNGIVVASSGDEIGDDFTDRAEVRAALKGAEAEAIRPRPAMSQRQPLSSRSRHAGVRLFVAVPVVSDGRIFGAVVLSRTPREEMQAIYQVVPRWGVAVALLATAAVAWAIGTAYKREVNRLGVIAERIGAGEVNALDELARPRRSVVREIGALATAVSAMAVRLRDRLRYISEFASNVSHEFKTPITTLRGTVELIRDDPDMPASQRARFLDNALAELDRLDRLVGGLLALARAEDVGERRAVLLRAVADAVAERNPGVAVEGAGGVVNGDATQLETAVGNLVANAFRHGGPGVRVTIALWTDGRKAGIDVIDDGAGISEANRARIFDRFFTTGRDVGGTGLGLALVRAIANAHGGTVDFESKPGRTVFRVALPHSP